MTGAEFTARYRLREQINDGPVATFRAIDARGSKVFVHVFRDPSAPPFDVATLDAAGAALVREVLDVEAITVVVTGEIEAFSTFEAWTADRQRKDAGEPGAYTRIFRIASPSEPEVAEGKTGASPLTQPPPRTKPVTPEIEPAPTRVTAEPADSGEYTRLFSVAADATPATRPDPMEHSTYSQIMRPPMAGTPPSPGSGATPIPPLVSASPPAQPPDVDPYPSRPPPPRPLPKPEASPAGPTTGAYTMFMRTGGPAGSNQEAPPTARQPDPPPRTREPLDSELYADNYSHRLRAPGPDVTPHNMPVPQEPPRLERSLYQSPAPAEPGSYTMIIGKGAQPAPPAFGLEPSGIHPPPPAMLAPQSPPPAKSKSKTPMVVMLVLIVAILVAMILFIALRPRA